MLHQSLSHLNLLHFKSGLLVCPSSNLLGAESIKVPQFVHKLVKLFNNLHVLQNRITNYVTLEPSQPRSVCLVSVSLSKKEWSLDTVKGG